MKNMKPVWRLNTGNGVPSDLDMCGEVSIVSGKIRPVRNRKGFGDTEPSRWELMGSSDIYAYRTTRTREAKYEMIDCDCCSGGYLQSTKGDRFLECWDCRGFGVTREAKR
jgi:hypothetical protein